jgi:hypothetical protein
MFAKKRNWKERRIISGSHHFLLSLLICEERGERRLINWYYQNCPHPLLAVRCFNWFFLCGFVLTKKNYTVALCYSWNFIFSEKSYKLLYKISWINLQSIFSLKLNRCILVKKKKTKLKHFFKSKKIL